MNLSTIINRCLTRHREAAQRRRGRQLAAASQRIIQVMEFNGRLYVAYNDEPILPASALNADIPEALNAARRAWVEHRSNFTTSRKW